MPTINLAWDASTDPDGNLAGYRVYAGNAPGTYNYPGTPLDVGNVLTASYPITAPGPHYFAVVAYDTTSLSSGYSNEVSVWTGLEAGPVFPALLAPRKQHGLWAIQTSAPVRVQEAARESLQLYFVA